MPMVASGDAAIDGDQRIGAGLGGKPPQPLDLATKARRRARRRSSRDRPASKVTMFDLMEDGHEKVDRRCRVEAPQRAARADPACPATSTSSMASARCRCASPSGWTWMISDAGLQHRRNDCNRIGHHEMDVLQHLRASTAATSGGPAVKAWAEDAIHDVEVQEGVVCRLQVGNGRAIGHGVGGEESDTGGRCNAPKEGLQRVARRKIVRSGKHRGLVSRAA